MVTRLVPVLIILFIKQTVELFSECIVPTLQCNQAVNILRHEECVLPWQSFRDPAVLPLRIEWPDPRPVCVSATREDRISIYHLAPVLPPVTKDRRIILLPQFPRHISKDCIVVRVFERARYLFVLVKCIVDMVLQRDVSIFEI